MNNESTSIKKKKAFGTREWAKYNFNIFNGCSHDCKYCYAKNMAIRFKRKTKRNWRLEELNEKTYNKRIKKLNGRIMFPTTHDLTPENIHLYVNILEKFLKADNDVLVVTKPHFSCIKTICDRFKDYKDKITFRFTIGSLKSEILKFWEPYAPSFEERFLALQYAYSNNYKTSISCEPMLDNNSEEFIKNFYRMLMTQFGWERQII